ncbi:MFS transporter [Thermodesulfobacteriota bacterium]
MNKVLSFLGLRRSMVGLLSMVILVGMGEKLAERFLPIYLLALGGGALSIGVLNGLDNLLSAIYSFPGGYLSDRLGVKRALLIFNLMAMTGFAIVILIPTWQAVIAGSFLFLSWTAISLPASMSLVAKVLPQDKRTMGVSLHSLIRRIPMALGPMVGGIFIGIWGERGGVRMAFVVAFAMAVLALFLQQKLIVEDHSRSADAGPRLTKNPLKVLHLLNPPLKNLLVSDILIRFCEQIPYAFAVVWCMKTIDAPISSVQFGVLTAVEMSTALLIYVPIAYLADRSTKKPFVVITFIFFTLFPMVLMFSQSFWPLVGAFVLRGLKEFGEPTRKALILDLAGEEREAATFGLYYLVRDTIVSVAAFGGALLWMISPETNFLTAFLFGATGTLWFAFKGSGFENIGFKDRKMPTP